MISKLFESIPFKRFKTQFIVSLPFFLICPVYFLARDSCLYPTLDCVSSTATDSHYFLFLGVFYYLLQPVVIFCHESHALFLAGLSGHFLSWIIFYCLFVPVVIFWFSNTFVESGHFLCSILFYCLLVPMIIFSPAFYCLWESVIIYWDRLCFIDLCSLSLLVAFHCHLVSVFSFSSRSYFIADRYRSSFSVMYFISCFIAVVIS